MPSRRLNLAPLMLSAVLLVTLAGCEEIKNFVTGNAEDLAVRRVSLIFEGIEGGKDDQRAISQFYKGIDLITGLEHLDAASTAFNRWQGEKDIFRKVKTWEIVEARQLEQKGAEPTTVLVTVKVNGRTLKMNVPHKQPITWAK